MNHLGDPTIFWILRLLLFGILFICGISISKTKKKSVAFYLWIAIIAFALVEGLRWMRGTDYENYYYIFKTGECDKDEPLYLLFVKFVHSLGINTTLVFVFLSGLLMAGLGIIFKIKELRVAAIWGFPLIYLMLGYNAENLVRQYMAISFLGFALYFYFLDKYKWMLLFLLTAPLIHVSSLLGVVFFLFFTWKKIGLINVWIFVGVYLAAYFLWNPDWLSNVALALGALDVNDSSAMSVYIENADRHFTEEGSISAKEGLDTHRSIINIALYFVTDIALIIAGHFACRKNQKLVLVYYFSFIGILCQVLFGDIQVLMRFGYYFSWMLPLLISIIAVYNNYGKYELLKYVVWFLLIARYAFYGVIHQIGRITMEEGCMFIWDK